ncbi:alpha/beta fold hydrolase [Hydrogenophaga sp. PAMC20947]|nr:alpha/beta fold hydrolase [Hydrogenophaga sp. PAMC20947]
MERAHALRCDAMRMLFGYLLKSLHLLLQPSGPVSRSRSAAWILGLVWLSLLSGCAGYDQWSRTKVYRPTPVQGAQAWERLLAERPDVTSFSVVVPPGHQQVAVLSVLASPGEVSPVRVLYLHGTFRHAFRNLPKTAAMHRAGLDVFLPDYRGWGISSVVLPSEASIDEDAMAVWQALRDETSTSTGSPPRPVRWVIYGHSMGSAVAIKLAAKLKSQGENVVCGVVLESALTSFSDVAYEAAGWPGRWLVALGREKMRAIDHIGDIPTPVWFLHGEFDKVIPMRLGRRLFNHAPEPKHWAEWPLEHSNLHTDPTGRYDQTWVDIKAACLAP